MPSFVEEAILRVKDQSSSKIAKINRELASLFRTARNGRDIRINVTGLTAAARDADRLTRAIRGLPSRRSIQVNMNTGPGTAIGKVNDLERRIRRLDSQRITVPVSLPGMASALADLRRMQTSVAAINRTSVRPNVRTPIPAAGPVATPTGAAAFAATPRTTATRGTGFGGAFNALSTTPFPGNLPAAFNIATAYLTVDAARIVARTAIDATLEGQAVETSTQLIIRDEATRQQVESVGREAAAGTTQVSIARGEKIARDLFVTGFRGEILEGLAPHIARLESAAVAINPEAAQSITTLANKMGNLAAVIEDETRAQELATGVYRAAVIQGETFNAPSLISAIRIGGFAQTIDDEGLVRIAASTDELGRSTGSGLQRLGKILTTQLSQAGAGSGVAKGIVEDLIAAGVRTPTGVADPERFAQDPLGWVEEVIGGLVRAQGLDPRDTEDRSEVRELLQQMGIQGTALRLVLNELSAGNERDRALALSRGLDPAATETAAADDLGFQLKNLTEQFKSFSSEGLDPLFSTLAPGVRTVADFLQQLALADDAGAGLRRLSASAGALAVIIGGLRVGSKLFDRFGGIRTAGVQLSAAGTSLQTAAAALQRAAAVQGGAGLAGGAGAVAGMGRGGRNPAPLPRAGGVLGMIGLFGASQIVGLEGRDRAAAIQRAGPNATDIEITEARIAIANERGAALNQDAEALLVSTAVGRWLNDRFTSQADIDSGRMVPREGLAGILGGYTLSEAAREEERVAAAVAELTETLDRQIAVFNRNNARIADPDRSEASRENLVGQQVNVAENIAAALSELPSDVRAEQVANMQETLGESLMVQIEELRGVDQDRAASLEMVANNFDDVLTNSAADMEAVFMTGADNLNSVGPTIDAAAAAFGPTAGEGILTVADEFGRRVAVQIAQASVGINLPAPVARPAEPRLDTGTLTPF